MYEAIEDREIAIQFHDLAPGDRVLVGGFPEQVLSVHHLGEGLFLVRTDASVFVRPWDHNIEVMR